MKNVSEWKPTKIKNYGDKFCVDESGMAPGSLYITLEAFRVVDSHKSYLHGHLVDLGCGNVPYYEWYKDRVDKVTCIDWPQSNHEAKYVDVFANLNQSLPLEDSSVDCVFSTSVLEHISEPLVLLKEISRILKQDGYLILSVPFLYHLHEEPFDYYRYTPHGLKHLAEKASLEVVLLKHFGNGFGVFVDVVSKIVEVLIGMICRFLPKYIAVFVKKIGTKILRLFQHSCFYILKQKPVLQIIDKANLSSRIALGYFAVFKLKNNTDVQSTPS
ncbi:conserved hypothetical protein [Hyella patelloides LEGE 07179]|uniref:Methyltransferase type 11 domain-containing protein n=1 Tax=Hyella patelloides LEGE 07179 TaxID=945734 RepID=A0A563VPA0_9CYAN|nr:class I SAM-dependent methyltransferase [Hyella patelloides]VEP13231.1 conserved hypothetical protein [Hyella patelloides LEGE 07179]